MHKKVKPAVIAHTPPPPLSQSPLYTSEMGDKAPPLPQIPAPDGTSQAQPAPPAQPDPKKHTTPPHHAKPSPAKPVGEGESTTAAKEAPPKEAGAAAPGAQTATAGGADAPSGTAPAPPTTVAKKATEDEAVASPIGQLTAGSTQDAGQSRREASELIRTTQNGVTGIKRSLTSDQNKIVLQIHSFLQQAQKALDNGDTDGAYTLATKARVLLDELLAPSS